MITKIKNNTKSILVFVLSLMISTISITSYAAYSVVGWGGGNYHGHGGGYGYGYEPGPGYYNRGGFFFGGGGWGGPNVIINVPAERYYAPPVCEEVQVCDTYTDQCWLEQRCGYPQ